MTGDDHLPVSEAVFVIREWTVPTTGTRLRFRRRDALANIGRRVIITADPFSRIGLIPEAVGKITKATATDGDLSVTVEITHGLLTVAFARFLTDHPEGAGAGLTVVTSPRGRDVKELRTLYPLPVCPAEPQCSPDCPHHNYPDGAAAKAHQRNRKARPPITVQEADHG